MTDEDPPDSSRGRTPAERAGATPLDPELFRASAGGLAADRRRTIDEVPAGPGGDESDYAIHRRRRRRAHSARPWWIASAVLAVVGVIALALAWVVESDVEVAAASDPDLVLSTPVASARRVPEVLARPVAARNLTAAVEPILADAPANTCLEVRDTGTAVTSHNGALPLVPASNMKLIVAAAALDLLGPDTRLTTRFATDGAPTDGSTVKGNLYMVGGGDPLLTTDAYAAQAVHGVQPATDLESVADQIYDTGVRRITGSVVGDESRDDAERSAAAWPQRYTTQGQVAPLSALLVNDGWRSSGGPVDDPALHAATVMGDLLEARGIQIDGAPQVGVVPPTATTLIEVPSLPVSDLVDESLRFSDNTTVELLVKELGVVKGAGGTTAAGVQVLKDWLAASGLPADGVTFDDGSGLSGNDRVTCQLFSALLSAQGDQGIVASGLAVPGESGTLDDRFLAEPLRSRVRAKTGTLMAVTSLSGWLLTDPGSNLAFSLLINTDGRNINESDATLQRRVLEAMLTYPQSPPVDQLAPTAPVAP